MFQKSAQNLAFSFFCNKTDRRVGFDLIDIVNKSLAGCCQMYRHIVNMCIICRGGRYAAHRSHNGTGAEVLRLLPSSSSYRCRIAFNLKGVQYDFTPVHLKNGAQKEAAFATLNPQELLPVLVTPTGAVLRQSLAIWNGWKKHTPRCRCCLWRGSNARWCGDLPRRSLVRFIRCKICGCCSICVGRWAAMIRR